MRRVVLVSALWSALAFGQSADVTGPELLSGNADEKLQAAAREAQASGRKLVISAPEYWHEMVLEQIRKAAPDVEVDLRDSFAESVMVRGESSAPAAPVDPVPEVVPAPAPAPAPAASVAETPRTPPPQPAASTPPPAPQPAPQPVQRSSAPPSASAPAPAPAPAQAAPAPRSSPPAQPVVERTPAPATQPPPVQAPPPQPQPQPQPERVAPAPPAAVATTPPPQPAPASPPAPAAEPATTTRSADAQIASIKRRLEQNLNAGGTVTATLSPTQLEVNDVIYAEGPVRAVLRRGSVRNTLFWLEGDIELRRVELRELAGDRYQVMQRINARDNVVLRAVRTADTDVFTAVAPAEASDERARMERRYNGGQPINETIGPTSLQQKDVLYLGDRLVVVVRLRGKSLERYWLVGDVNLGRRELIRDGNNKYKVLADIRN